MGAGHVEWAQAGVGAPVHPGGDIVVLGLEEVVEQIRSSHDGHRGYRHSFWDRFSQGSFQLEQLRAFALQYWQHVRIFRLYVAGVLTVVQTEDLQRVLAENLADECGVLPESRESHPKLFRRFMVSVGLNEPDWVPYEPLVGFERFKDIHFALFRGNLVPESIGAFIFGMELTTPYRHGKVLTGIQNSGLLAKLPVDASFFDRHVNTDLDHGAELVEAAAPIILADPEGVERGAKISFDARALLLDSLELAVFPASSR